MHEKDIENQQKKIEEYYDQLIDRQKQFGINDRHLSILDKSVKSGLLPTHSVLEIGCGIGTFSEILAEYVKEGNILSLDISEESVKVAQEVVKKKGIAFVHADATDYDFKGKQFDFIILPDVVEHIPKELHKKLFSKLAEVLKKNGVVFIHIPNPFYLEWCHQVRPETLQVIDQPIFTEMVLDAIYDTALVIVELKNYSIWVEDSDYQYIVLRRKDSFDFSREINKKPTLKRRIREKMEIILNKKKG